MGTKTLGALRNGDEKAFDTIFIAYFGKVKYFISGILKSDADAEELAQDVFVRLWEKRQSIDPQKSLNAYIYTVARNAAFNFLKHQSIHNTYVNESLNNDESEDAEQTIFAREIDLLVKMSVEKMPAKRQAIYRLSREEGISNEDIAIRLNISRKTVENQLSLALQELRRVLSGLFIFFI